MKKLNLFSTVCVICVLIFAGCGGSANTGTNDALNGKWMLKNLGDKEVVKEKAGKEIPNLSLNLKENKVGGSTGCNALDGNVSVLRDEITFSNMSMTKMNCQNAGYEMEFVNLIFHSETLKYKIDNNVLTFIKSGNVIMTLEKIK